MLLRLFKIAYNCFHIIARLFDAVEEIRKLFVDAPVKTGTIVLHGILGFDSDVIVTKSVEKRIEEDLEIGERLDKFS